MARTLHKLTDLTAKSERLTTGRHSDGGGLYLSVSPSGSKSWVFMWSRDGKRREMGLGAYPSVSLAIARGRASDSRKAVEQGRDPIAEKTKIAEPTFGECADLLIAAMSPSWRNAKHRAQWKMTLTDYCASIRAKQVSAINTDDVQKVLKPIWHEKPETASRLRGRIERVLSYAKTQGWRSGDNPALWRGHLDNAFPPAKKLYRGHHAAMPYVDVPAFITKLRSSDAMAAAVLEFLILTASRTSEALGARWDEMDFASAVWTVPASRMKAKREHRVPLSGRALEILKKRNELRISEYVFPGQKKDSSLSSSAMEMLLRRLKTDQYTVHGFRSAFRDYAADKTNTPSEVAEAALAHIVGSASERAYRRTDALGKRRKLMQVWADHCANNKSKSANDPE